MAWVVACWEWSAEGHLWMGDDGGYSHRTTQAMSEEQLKAFLEAVKADTGLQEKLKGVVDADAVVVMAKVSGFVISVEAVTGQGQELSDEELEGIAGGTQAKFVVDAFQGKICGTFSLWP